MCYDREAGRTCLIFRKGDQQASRAKGVTAILDEDWIIQDWLANSTSDQRFKVIRKAILIILFSWLDKEL